MSDDDPLAGAAVGETRTITHEQTVDTVSALPPECYGTDRGIDVEIVGAEVVDTPHSDDPDDVQIQYEVELTKHLPRRWDHCREPRTTEESRQARRRTWGRRIAKALGTAIPALATAGLASVITNRVFREITINGEPAQPPSDPQLAGWLLFMIALFMLVAWAVNGGLPRMGATYR